MLRNALQKQPHAPTVNRSKGISSLMPAKRPSANSQKPKGRKKKIQVAVVAEKDSIPTQRAYSPVEFTSVLEVTLIFLDIQKMPDKSKGLEIIRSSTP
jgi:hypothetical protein